MPPKKARNGRAEFADIKVTQRYAPRLRKNCFRTDAVNGGGGRIQLLPQTKPNNGNKNTICR